MEASVPESLSPTFEWAGKFNSKTNLVPRVSLLPVPWSERETLGRECSKTLAVGADFFLMKKESDFRKYRGESVDVV